MSIFLTPLERMRRRLNGEEVDRVPNFNIIMAFGAHYIGAQLSSYFLDYRTLVRSNLAMLAEFELDLVQVISDPYREAFDFGTPVAFPEDGLPMRTQPLLLNPNDLRELRPPDPASGRRMSDRLEAIRTLREQVSDQVTVMGWVEGALAEANILRGDSALMTDLYDRPDWVRELLEICTEVEIDFARAQIEAGANLIGLGDAIASTVSPRMYKNFVLPYEQRVFSAIHEMGALARLHICGDTHKIVPLMAESGADIIDIDWMVDMRAAAEEFAKHSINGVSPAVCGNFDPVQVMYNGSPDEVYCATWANLEQGGPRCFSAAGCEIPDGSPHVNLRAQNSALKDFILPGAPQHDCA